MSGQKQSKMNEFKFTGKITGIGPVKNGKTKSNKEWSKREFVVQEEKDKYPQSAKFSMFKMDEHQKYVTGFEDTFKVGDNVVVEFKLETSTGAKGTFNNISCWRIDKDGGSSNQQHDEGPLFT